MRMGDSGFLALRWLDCADDWSGENNDVLVRCYSSAAQMVSICLSNSASFTARGARVGLSMAEADML